MVRFPVKNLTPIKQHCNPKSPYSHLFSFIAASGITSPLSLPPSRSILADASTTPLFIMDKDADKPPILQRLYSGHLKQNVTHRKNPHISAYTLSSTPKRLKSRLFTNSLLTTKKTKPDVSRHARLSATEANSALCPSPFTASDGKIQFHPKLKQGRKKKSVTAVPSKAKAAPKGESKGCS